MFWCDFIAGWVGGCTGIIVGHPFDTVKVRQQAFHGHTSLRAVVVSCIKHEGVRGLFKGMLYPMVSAGALNSLFFGVYGLSLRGLMSFRGNPEKPTYLDIYLAGCAGGVAQLVIACPIDLAKIKLQTQTGHENPKIFHESHFRGPYDVLRSLHRQFGVQGWYKGLPIMAVRDVKASGIYVVTYHHLLGEDTSSSTIFMAGGLAGTISWMSIIYLDVVKSRIQADDPKNPYYKGTIDCFQKCYKEGGLRIFTRGWLVTALRAFPLNGATFLGYDYCLTACRKFHSEENEL